MSSRFLSHDIVDKGTLVHIAQRSRADNLIVLLSKSLHIHFENAKKHCHFVRNCTMLGYSVNVYNRKDKK